MGEQSLRRFDLKVCAQGTKFGRRRVYPPGLDAHDDVAVDARVLHDTSLGQSSLTTEEFEIQHVRLLDPNGIIGTVRHLLAGEFSYKQRGFGRVCPLGVEFRMNVPSRSAPAAGYDYRVKDLKLQVFLCASGVPSDIDHFGGRQPKTRERKALLLRGMALIRRNGILRSHLCPMWTALTMSAAFSLRINLGKASYQ